jgi:TolB-like protein/Tfp pilus assembly protein PilF/predicted Ser/Thr protein kinase
MLGDFGDYELLQEIGRGGQGVVYRAHQKSLNRTVAVKVIGLGPWATEAHLKRFRREAEAAASLNHPFIVPIHEVGEREGFCYFSMNFVEGGQLDEVVKQTPISIRQAAELIAKVARTVQYAHEHGILHRDIKPGNILLDAQGEPYLTDFGLARLVEAESTVTGTLEVLGTPSYMAPEQAAGDTTKVSKATDVYGLGAVLYQLLTGHPPFAGGTTYETIKLLLDTEPRQPRVLNRKIDRDLSTICLKCIEKDPKRRYSSALALAEDLEHWLKHEPIQAKPSGFFTHSRKWVRRNPSTALSTTLLVVFAMGLGVIVCNRKPPVLIPKSVAVLPFENLSDDPDNAYFAEGIQEEILTRLASIADLKVISRTSTQRYHSRPGNLGEIAKQLGVANILEGSVQKAAGQVRVNVQLINAQTDSHLWADTYDRKLTDIFGVESEIAKQIAESLQAKLTGREEQALAVKPTNNPEAYDAYLRGLAFETRSALSLDLLWKAIYFYEQAVQLDPNFALAWARLSRVDAFLYFNTADTTVARRDAAKRTLENAQKLDPNSAETQLALGYYQYWVLRDYRAAKTMFGRVSRLLPGSSEVPYALGLVTRREGQWDESVAYFEQALALDPRNVDLLNQTAGTYAMRRQFPAALKLYDRALDILPNDPYLTGIKARIYQAQGNLKEAANMLVEINGQTPSMDALLTKITQLRLERNHGEAVRLLQARLAQFHFDSEIEKAMNQLLLAGSQRDAGDAASAKASAEQARNALESLVHKDQQHNTTLAGNLADIYALLGNKELALKEAERAITLSPDAKDAVYGPNDEENLALIQTMFGETSRPISTLTRLLQTPYSSWLYPTTAITPALLRLDPIWDPLRSDPAFLKLCEDKLDKSIAVLPFQNLSDEKENAYFADGIQDDILTSLSKIADLKVISRTSVMSYRGDSARDAREIGKALGVATLLEGSVRRVGNRVRVNVQFINANNDEHIWAENYDRDLTDIFAIQTDLAQKIASALQAKLSPNEKARLNRRATKDSEAYLLYVQAHDYANRPDRLRDDSLKAEELFEKAIKLDPNFALAFAGLSEVESWMYRQDEPTSTRQEKALLNANESLRLQPDLPEGHLALGFSYYYCDRNYERALTECEIAKRDLPNQSQAYLVIGAIQRRQGKWAESTVNLERSASLDPKNAYVIFNLGLSYMYQRDFKTADKIFDWALVASPQMFLSRAAKAVLAIRSNGDFGSAENQFSSIPPGFDPEGVVTSNRVWVLTLQRKFADALHVLQQFRGQMLNDRKFGLCPKALLQGRLYLYQDDKMEAQAALERARPLAEQLVREAPDDSGRHAQLGTVLAGLSRKEDAINEGRKTVELLPESKDAVDGPDATAVLAEIYARVGEPDEAFRLLDHLLQIPNGKTVPELTLDPVWDPLRNDPRFQALIDKYSTKS